MITDDSHMIVSCLGEIYLQPECTMAYGIHPSMSCKRLEAWSRKINQSQVTETTVLYLPLQNLIQCMTLSNLHLILMSEKEICLDVSSSFDISASLLFLKPTKICTSRKYILLWYWSMKSLIIPYILILYTDDKRNWSSHTIQMSRKYPTAIEKNYI